MACLVLIFYVSLKKRASKLLFLIPWRVKSLGEIMRVESHSEPKYQGQVLYFQKIPENAKAHIELESEGWEGQLSLACPTLSFYRKAE